VLGRLAYFITEREAVRVARAAGRPAPWTADPILRTYRFCNVRRADDRVSRWLLDNWYGPHKDHPNILAACALARLFNQPSTLNVIGLYVFKPTGRGAPWWDKIKHAVQQLRGRGDRVFNAAYIVSTAGNKADKVEWVVDAYARPLFEAGIAINPASMRDTCEAIQTCYGYKGFMAGQVTADLRWAMSGTWADRHAWAPLGPGSTRGLRRLYTGSVDSNVPAPQLPKFFNRMLGEIKLLLPPAITKRLEAMDYQNCLCEFDKYERVLWGEGRPKQLYPGG